MKTPFPSTPLRVLLSSSVQKKEREKKKERERERETHILRTGWSGYSLLLRDTEKYIRMKWDPCFLKLWNKEFIIESVLHFHPPAADILTTSFLKMSSSFSSSCTFTAETDSFTASKEKLWLKVMLGKSLEREESLIERTFYREKYIKGEADHLNIQPGLCFPKGCTHDGWIQLV